MSTVHNITLRYRPLVLALIDAGIMQHWWVLRLVPAKRHPFIG